MSRLLGLVLHNRHKTHCGKGHPFSEENTHRRPDGSRRCKTCHKAQERGRYRDNPEVSAKVKLRSNARRFSHAEAISGYKKSYRRRESLKKLGLSWDDFERLLKEQEDRCFVCKREDVVLCIDHDHVTGKVRGLLCHNCNLGVGNFKDNPDFLRKAANYLERG